MKYFLISVILVSFQGCSHRNAFSNFDLTLTQRNIVSNTQSAKINSLRGINGIFHLVYLNNRAIKVEKHRENFLLSIYIKKGDINNYNFYLNNTPALKIKEVDTNKYDQVIHKTQTWNKYYLITFKQCEKKTMDFVLQDKQGIESKLTYRKY